MLTTRLQQVWALLSRPIVLVGLGLAVVLVIGLLAASRTQAALSVEVASRQSIRVAGPLQVDFSQDIAPGYRAVITPAVPGRWQDEHSILGVSAVAFKPSNRFEAGRKYTLRLTGLKRVGTGASMPDVIQTFVAQAPPAFQSVLPAADSKDVAVRPRFTVTLTSANRGVRDLQPSLTPAVALKLVSNDDRVFTWEPVVPLAHGTAYVFAVDDGHMQSAGKKRLATTPFTTVSQPGIVSARTGGLFGRTDTVDIVFDQPMASGSDGFQFDFKGKGSWINDRTYRYVPEGLAPGTSYAYKAKAGLASKAGGVLEADRPFSFTTNGAVTAALSPGGTVGINTPIRVAFDQAVDHASAEARFSVQPGVAGKFSWSGNTMVFAPAGTAYQTSYTYSVAAGVVPAWGLPSARPMSRAFTTETQIIKLGVPAYKQTFGRSCELSSLRMALAFRGIRVSDMDILGRMAYNPRPRDTATNSWDNPNEMFVGQVNTQSWSQGYGVHAGPLAAAGRSYGRGATAHFGVSPAFIASQIHAGNPVIFYGHISPPRPDAWNTSSGVVQTTTSMHARVVYGVVGRADAPVGFHIIDPWTGSKVYWTAGQLAANMNAAPPVSNQAVVVF
jgi:uncharacterized protein YvpB